VVAARPSSKDVVAVPSFPLSCLAYLSVAVPGSTLGLLWPLMRLSWHQPLGLLGLLLIIGVSASVAASVLTGRLLSRVPTGPIVAGGVAAIALALAGESAAPSVWVFAGGMVVFGVGSGALDTALNTHAATRFGPRRINWMHASYGLGATGGPLLATGLLAAGLGWRGVFAAQAAVQAVVAVLLSLTWRAWDRPGPTQPTVAPPAPAQSEPARPEITRSAPTSPPASSVLPAPKTSSAPKAPATPATPRARAGALLVLLAAAFAAIECGIESGAGIWGYVFLTAGRGLSGPAAAGTVSAYWATMFAGRAVLGPVAERFGPGRVLTGGVAGLVAGAALLTVPGPAAVPVAGLAVVGLAAAPIFPLLTLATAERTGGADPTQAISLQVAASAGGNAALPAGLGLIIGALTASALGPALLLLSLLLAGLHRWLGRRTGAAGPA
jgi:fucose permease